MRAMNKRRLECLEQKTKVENQMIKASIDLAIKKDSLSHSKYVLLDKQHKELVDKYHDLIVELDVWDQAMEICIDLIDAVL